MSTHQIHIFVSHSWTYSSHYKTLASWIFKEKWHVGQVPLNFRDFSVPKDDPIHNAPTIGQLRNAIYRKIALCHVIVIPTGMYATHSNWIRKEIDGANEKGKPILAVNPWGQQRTSSVVSAASNKTVGWNKESVIKGIWNIYRP